MHHSGIHKLACFTFPPNMHNIQHALQLAGVIMLTCVLTYMVSLQIALFHLWTLILLVPTLPYNAETHSPNLCLRPSWMWKSLVLRSSSMYLYEKGVWCSEKLYLSNVVAFLSSFRAWIRLQNALLNVDYVTNCILDQIEHRENLYPMNNSLPMFANHIMQ